MREHFNDKGVPRFGYLSPHCVVPAVVSIIQIPVTDLYNGLCWQFLQIDDFKPMAGVFGANWVG